MTDSTYDEKKIIRKQKPDNIIIVANKPIYLYMWTVMNRLTEYDEIVLSTTGYYLSKVEQILRILKYVGIQEKKRTTETKRISINDKLEEREVHIITCEKLGLLRGIA